MSPDVGLGFLAGFVIAEGSGLILVSLYDLMDSSGSLANVLLYGFSMYFNPRQFL